MRLIDADRMKQNIFDDGGHETAAVLRTWVENQITIDAIPVEWLKDKMQKPQMTDGNPFGFVLAEWLEERGKEK